MHSIKHSIMIFLYTLSHISEVPSVSRLTTSFASLNPSIFLQLGRPAQHLMPQHPNPLWDALHESKLYCMRPVSCSSVGDAQCGQSMPCIHLWLWNQPASTSQVSFSFRSNSTGDQTLHKDPSVTIFIMQSATEVVKESHGRRKHSLP